MLEMQVLILVQWRRLREEPGPEGGTWSGKLGWEWARGLRHLSEAWRGLKQ